MRTAEGRVAGSGTDWAFHEDEETWHNQAVSVRFPSDGLNDESLAAMSGECITVKEGVRK